MTSSASSLPDWVLLDTGVSDDDDSFPADPSTEACSTNSRGDAIRVCFQLHAPPRPSRLCLSWPAGKEACVRFSVVAAHRDAVLLQLMYPLADSGLDFPVDMYDYFLYTAGAGGSSRSPSLVRIPSIDGDVDEFRAMTKAGRFRFKNQRLRRRDGLDIGVLRRGEDFAVAELEIPTRPQEEPPELHVFRSGRRRWEVKHPQIVHGDDVDMNSILFYWHGDKVFPMGSYLCWVDYCVGGMFLCKVLDEDDDDPVLQYLQLPAVLPGLGRDFHGRSVPSFYHTLAVDEERGTVKFVMVSDGDGNMIEIHFSRIPCSFIIKSWTLTMEDMNWNSEVTVSSQELLGPHGFKQLPPTGVYLPVAAMDDRRIVYFACLVQRPGTEGFRDCDLALVAVDIVNKSLKSPPCIDDLGFVSLLATQIPKYFKMGGAS
ncbi:hypothetical protein ACP70R_030830 [Stipagrostis hirtigluma subsp. patula]